MQIIDKESVWITAIVDGRWIQAKVYQEPSIFGINEGMVSKLAICKTAFRDPNSNFFDQMDYNYDRGLDFDNLNDPSLLNSIIKQLEDFRKNNPYIVD